MVFASHFPALRPSLVLRNPNLLTGSIAGRINVLNKSFCLGLGSIDSNNSESNQLEKATVEATDHLIIDDTDRPTARQIKTLNAKVQYLRKQLEAKPNGDSIESQDPTGSGTKVVHHPPSWTEVVTQNSVVLV
ncbi:hypothetical protein RHGRI_033477 [Rhododendron griersonianum]|uniref:Uncharacterized protein n=1 Tax=Rhododendron griersonianum TaxID=479676 RepID=A0AAV6I0Q2_9ERIC|nr:hypothetical protein RHGRI_033477 [Rhododendron griersonianum]